MINFENNITYFKKYISNYKYLVVITFIILFFSSIFEGIGLGMLIPILESLQNQVSDNVFVKYTHIFIGLVGLDYSFNSIIVLFGILILFSLGFHALYQILSRKLSAAITYDLRKKAFGNLMNIPLRYYYNKKNGDIIATLYTSSNNTGAIIEVFLLMISGLSFTIMYFTINLLISIPLTLISIGLAVVSYFIVIPKFKVGFTQGKEEKSITDDMTSFIQDTIGGIKTVKSFHNENYHIQLFENFNESYRLLQIKIQNNRVFASLLLEPFITILIIFIMIFSVSVLDIQIASLITFLFIFTRILPKVKIINQNYMQIMNLLQHFRKIDELIETKNYKYLIDGKKEITEFKKEILFDNVSFRYEGIKNYVLENINLTFPKNKTIGIVGMSGGGKSTLIDLLIRHHDPESGRISIDGIDLKNFRKDSLYKLISKVDQDVYLFNDTIYNNILYGKLDANEHEIIQASKLANADQFISAMPDGYLSRVGDRGVRLSGGEKQRISLARALLKNPSLLILDEATSSLDSQSEKLIQDAIGKLSGKKTIIIIAHRLSTVLSADIIYVIEKGIIIESGAPKELIDKNGLFAQYHKLQNNI